MLANYLSLAWHFHRQQYHTIHQRLLRWVYGTLLLFMLVLGQSSGNIQHYLQQNLQGLLGADAVISQKQSLTSPQLTQLTSIAEQVVTTRQIKVMLSHGQQWQQASLKVVDQQYPLQGQVISAASLQGQGESHFARPQPGNIWLDARLIAALSIKLGEQLIIAEQPFTVSRILQHEPDRLMEGHNVDMRAMINAQDFAALKLADDLVQYRYLLAIDKSNISDLVAWQTQHIPSAQLFHKQGRHPLALFWQRTENFIGLASVVLFFMAAIAIEQLSQVHKRKDQYFSAVCISLGATRAMGIKVSLLKWAINLALLLPIVLPLSLLGHYLIIHFLTETFVDLTWHWQFSAFIKPFVAVLLLCAIFHLPVWLSLAKLSVAQLFNQVKQGKQLWRSKITSFIVLILLAFYYSDNGLLTLMMLIVICATILLMVFLSWLGLTLAEKLSQTFSGLLPFALFMMKQRLLSKSTQILGVGLCAFLLLFTLMLLKDLGNTMSAYQRQHDGNVFISQASKSQMRFIEHWAEENNIAVRQSKPYVHAKLVAINDLALAEFSQQPSESMATMSKSIRMHWSENVPANNRVVSGQWWQERSANWQQVSVEDEVMTDLGLALGDRLSFVINQQQYHFTIAASHVFKPGADSVTFWVQMPPSALSHMSAPIYYMASLEVSEQQWPLLAPLWQKYPSLRMVSLQQLTALFDQMLLMITKVISGFSLLIITLSIIVILATISALAPKEQRKNSIILSFGFTRVTCWQLNIIEWLVTAFIAAFGAIFGTYLAGQLLYQAQFSFNYQPDMLWLFSALSLILLVVTGIGSYASRHSLKSSVRSLLQEQS